VVQGAGGQDERGEDEILEGREYSHTEKIYNIIRKTEPTTNAMAPQPPKQKKRYIFIINKY
jgi:hypothetical protein